MKFQRTRLQLGLFIAGFAAQGVPPQPYQTGSVTGIVRTPDGAPAANVRVTALRAEAVADALRAMASLAQTDASGRYLLENVPPGIYYITAGRVDLPTYYPGTLEIAKGATVSIISAGVISNIDFIVQDTSAATAPGLLGNRGRGGQAAPFVPLVSPVVVQGGLRGPGAAGAGTAAVVLPYSRGNIITGGMAPLFAWQPNSGWWTNAALAMRLGLTEDQRKRVEASAERHRQVLEQNKADLEKEEAALALLLDREILDPANIVSAQSERVVQARAALERTSSKLTLEMREILTRSQWVQLRSEPQPVALPVLVPGGRSVGLRGGGPGTP